MHVDLTSINKTNCANGNFKLWTIIGWNVLHIAMLQKSHSYEQEQILIVYLISI